MKNLITLLSLLLSSVTCHSQNQLEKNQLEKMRGFWQNVNEESIIEYYYDNTYLTFLYSEKKDGFSGGKYPSIIGFYNSCDVPHVDSLNASGFYFFELDPDEINDDGSVEEYQCLELSFSEENGEEYINIYRSSQQQFSTLRKLKKLPKNLKEYLKDQFPEIYKEYSNF